MDSCDNMSLEVNPFAKNISQPFHPFIKWAGGKSRLISQIKNFIPKDFNNYFEPFVGSGALFFYMVKSFKIKREFCAHLSDINSELINVYKTIKDNLTDLIQELQYNEIEYYKNPKRFYYKLRAENFEFNSIKKAARFITLNKTCYNGLYRVNKKDLFNVPIGKYINPKICDFQNLTKVNQIMNLTNTILEDYDYYNITLKIKENDFIYFDPPYHPLNETSKFTNYTSYGFDYNQQKRLANFFYELDKRKCKILLSNSDTTFVRDLYSSFTENIVSLKTLRSINSNSEKRKNHSELIIKNF
ncbi:MAG TPA: Dam family site-specific DNA-(adenine-N6)-methyltransferase [Nitrososphaeraceae archaeon]|nr:Dam family site-specific DNA-(adenine-N6)-methyltransferase [Nitrososphaeraceae archaeon]